jgi:hypothetical protein
MTSVFALSRALRNYLKRAVHVQKNGRHNSNIEMTYIIGQFVDIGLKDFRP